MDCPDISLRTLLEQRIAAEAATCNAWQIAHERVHTLLAADLLRAQSQANEWRATLADQTQRFVTADYYNPHHEALEERIGQVEHAVTERINQIERAQAALAGRLWALGITMGLIALAAQYFLRH